MNANEQCITTFYTAFQNKDFKTMQQCYADNAVFTDEVFIDLDAKKVRAMWEMLIKGGKDLQVEFSDVKADEKEGSANWVATYTFSKTGKKVINRIHAKFIFENGKIINHRDTFSFPTWSKQALGFTGLLLGRTKYLRNKVQQMANKNLIKFMG